MEKETFEKLKRIYDQADKAGREIIEKEFPELKESIDERVKNVIKQVLDESTYEKDECYLDNGVTQHEVFAWLEKQGTQKPNFCHHEVDFSNCSEEYRKAYYDVWNNCNQQHAQLEAEQKPAWSEEDEKMLNTVIEKGDLKPSEIYWLYSLKERMKGE